MLARWLIILANFPAVLTAIISCVFAVWFSKYQDRNVGPSVIYMAYASISLVAALMFNLMFWIALRKRDSDLRFLRRTAVGVLAFCLVFIWIENRFSYVGERYALTRSLWAAIKMKDPPMLVPFKSEASAPTAPTGTAPESTPCQKSCK